MTTVWPASWRSSSPLPRWSPRSPASSRRTPRTRPATDATRPSSCRSRHSPARRARSRTRRSISRRSSATSSSGRRSGNALLASLYAGERYPARQQALQRESERWSTLADSTLKLTDIDPAGDFGPEKDPTFPRRYFANATEESLRLNALQDAANEQAAIIDQRAAAYTAILATLAVSLYLFGLTLAVQRPLAALGFLAVGLVLLGVGTLWMASDDAAARVRDERRRRRPSTPRGACAALTAVDATGFHDAEAHYTTAIKAAADVRARLRGPSLGHLPGRAPAAHRLRQHRAAGSAGARAGRPRDGPRATVWRTPQTFGDLGFYAFAEGIQSGDLSLLNQSVAVHAARRSRSTRASPSIATTWAWRWPPSGRIDDARNAYNDAVAAHAVRRRRADGSHAATRRQRRRSWAAR